MKRVCIVTGGSNGIGKATAELLAENGYTVYEFSRGGKDYGAVRHVTADVTDPIQVRAAVKTVLDAEGSIDLLVSNAGFGISGAVEFTDLADAHAQMDVNFFGALHCVQAVLPIMRAAKRGHIVLVSSVAAPIAIPFQSFYSATKAAVNSLTLALRNELKPFGIKVCAVLPGDVKTGFTAARKKSLAGAEVYGTALDHAVAVMEHDEQNGMPPVRVAKAVLAAAGEKNPRAFRTVGFQYQLFVFLAKLLPATWVNALVGMIYK
ncbi:MAG: SDR family NAD(P)-dependent oxidoreductase [Clostridiaceae bacterium]